MADDLSPQKKKPLLSLEFQTEIDPSTGAAERRVFVKMYFEARDSGLLADIPDREWKTLCALVTYMDENGLCFPSQGRIAKDLGIARETVNRRVRQLLDYRFQGNPLITLSKHRTRGPNGSRWANNVYHIRPITGFSIFDHDDDRKPKTPTESEPKAYVTESSHRASDDQKRHIQNRHTNQNQFSNQIVTSLPTNDQNQIPRKEERRQARISDRALRSTYGFTDAQVGQVHYLVEKQISLLGSAQQNHGLYVERAAAAITAGTDQLLDYTLGDFREYAQRKSVDKPSAYFTTMWNEALEKRASPRTTTLPRLTTSPQPSSFEPADSNIGRLLDDAAARGFSAPESIRRSSHYPTVARWWAELPERKENQDPTPGKASGG